MALTVNSIGANPQQPGIAAELFVPDQLIAGNLKLVTDSATISGVAAMQRGAVLGRVTATGKYILCLSAAVDGSQTPAAILVDYYDGTEAIGGVYLMGEFNGSALTFGTGTTLANCKVPFLNCGIFIKTNVSATDPT